MTWLDYDGQSAEDHAESVELGRAWERAHRITAVRAAIDAGDFAVIGEDENGREVAVLTQPARVSTPGGERPAIPAGTWVYPDGTIVSQDTHVSIDDWDQQEAIPGADLTTPGPVATSHWRDLHPAFLPPLARKFTPELLIRREQDAAERAEHERRAQETWERQQRQQREAEEAERAAEQQQQPALEGAMAAAFRRMGRRG